MVASSLGDCWESAIWMRPGPPSMGPRGPLRRPRAGLKGVALAHFALRVTAKHDRDHDEVTAKGRGLAFCLLDVGVRSPSQYARLPVVLARWIFGAPSSRVRRSGTAPNRETGSGWAPHSGCSHSVDCGFVRLAPWPTARFGSHRRSCDLSPGAQALRRGAHPVRDPGRAVGSSASERRVLGSVAPSRSATRSTERRQRAG